MIPVSKTICTNLFQVTGLKQLQTYLFNKGTLGQLDNIWWFNDGNLCQLGDVWWLDTYLFKDGTFIGQPGVIWWYSRDLLVYFEPTWHFLMVSHSLVY